MLRLRESTKCGRVLFVPARSHSAHEDKSSDKRPRPIQYATVRNSKSRGVTVGQQITKHGRSPHSELQWGRRVTAHSRYSGRTRTPCASLLAPCRVRSSGRLTSTSYSTRRCVLFSLLPPADFPKQATQTFGKRKRHPTAVRRLQVDRLIYFPFAVSGPKTDFPSMSTRTAQIFHSGARGAAPRKNYD